MSIAAAAVFIGSITVGALMGYMSGFWKMMNSITRVIDRIPEFANLTAYINRTEDFAATARPNVHNDIAHVRLQAADIGFADPVIQQLDLDIQQGEHVLLLGQNGCGKTTLLHTLACAHQPATGDFSVFGVNPWSLGNAERHNLRAHFFLALK